MPLHVDASVIWLCTVVFFIILFLPEKNSIILLMFICCTAFSRRFSIPENDKSPVAFWLFSVKKQNLQNVYIWFVQVAKSCDAEFVQDSASHIREAIFY